jgi:hypothetical protein
MATEKTVARIMDNSIILGFKLHRMWMVKIYLQVFRMRDNIRKSRRNYGHFIMFGTNLSRAYFVVGEDGLRRFDPWLISFMQHRWYSCLPRDLSRSSRRLKNY